MHTMHMLIRIHFDVHVIVSVCDHCGNVFDERVRRGFRVRGWLVAVSRLHLCSGLRIHIDYHHRVRG
jgi:hypothetical protein